MLFAQPGWYSQSSILILFVHLFSIVLFIQNLCTHLSMLVTGHLELHMQYNQISFCTITFNGHKCENLLTWIFFLLKFVYVS
jgi:hypothetical protein